MITRSSRRLAAKSKVANDNPLENKQDAGHSRPQQSIEEPDIHEAAPSKTKKVASKEVASTPKRIKRQVSTKATTQTVERKSKPINEKKRKEPAQDIDSDKDDDTPVKSVWPKKKLRHDPLNYCCQVTADPVIEHLKKFSSWIQDQQVSLEAEILDQIALEGLSGITLAKLFHILNAIYPSLRCIEDEKCANFIWTILLNKYFRYPTETSVAAFYVDPDYCYAREAANINNGNRNIHKDKEIKLPPQTVERFVKSESTLFPIQDGLIMGSCKNYTMRKDITQELIDIADKEGVINSLHTLNEHYGILNVYFVAGQGVRSRAILPDWADPNIDIKLREYCALELIGKSRTLGTVFPNDKTLGRYRIMLMSKGFITQYQETSSSPIEHHLKRFSSTRPPSKFSEKLAKTRAKNQADSSSEDDDEDGPERRSAAICDPNILKVDRSIFSMVYDVIAESKGLIALDIRRKLQLPKFHIRNHLKNLLAIEVVYNKTYNNPDKYGFRVYKTTHRSMKRKRRCEELAEPTGIMVSWDEADLRAKKIIGHKRSSFSQAEDSLLILCRITSILIDNTLKLSYCVHKHIIRDILHKELIESHDKTSDACLRRIKYLKKLPNNIMSINELTAELRDDPDIVRLTQPDRPALSDERLNKLFVQVLRLVRAKIPSLLGLTSSTPAIPRPGPKIWVRDIQSNRIGNEVVTEVKNHSFEIKSVEELREKYELLDCQSLASFMRAPTYERPKNVVDVKFNQATLVTMAFTMTLCFAKSSEERYKRANFWLLDRFYSNYHDKLINSMLSKLNKRSLLTRKNASDKAVFYKPKTRISLKLNQSVLFLLNRYQSHSLMQLAYPINQDYDIDLSESNYMFSIALLTSLSSMSLFKLNMNLRIPSNVVGIDQGNENFRTLCERASDGTREILSRFMSRCGGSLEAAARTTSETIKASPEQQPPSPVHETFETDTMVTEVELDESGSYATLRPVQEITIEKDEQSNFIVEEEAIKEKIPNLEESEDIASTSKMDDSRRALFLLRHELKAHALDKCGSLADCLIVQPCNIKFYSDERIKLNSDSLDKFLDKSKSTCLVKEEVAQQQQPQQPQQLKSNWLVKSFKLIDNDDPVSGADQDQPNEPIRLPVEFEARLWKSIDGEVHLPTLFKLIESLLSWIIVFPGVEGDTLQREFGHLMPGEHLLELLTLMEELNLISKSELRVPAERPRLFGYTQRAKDNQGKLPILTTYESTPGAFIQFCQLITNYLN